MGLITAFVLAGIQGTAQGYLRPSPPMLTNIDARADSVWFVQSSRGWSRAERRYVPDSLVLGYAFDKKSEAWTGPRRIPALPGNGGRISYEYGRSRDTLVTTDGFLLIALPWSDKPDPSIMAFWGTPNRYAVTVLPSGRRIPVRLQVTPEEARRRFFESVCCFRSTELPEGVEPYFEYGAGFGAWLLRGDTLWLGMLGSVPETLGGTGGLLRIDLDEGSIRQIDHEALSHDDVSDLAVIGDGLWISTLFHGELRWYGKNGLLRYDLRDRTWDRYRAADTGLPDDGIHAIAADGTLLWLSTLAGPSVLDTETGHWRSWRFVPDLKGEEVVFDLVSADEPVNRVHLAIFRLMDLLGTDRKQEFRAAARSLPESHWKAYASGSFYRDDHDDYPRATGALAHPVFEPFLREAVETWLRRYGGRHCVATCGLAKDALARLEGRRP